MSGPITISQALVSKDIALMARVVSKDGTGANVSLEGLALKQADVSTITRTVYDLDSPNPGNQVAGPTSLTVATAILNALTVDNNWGRLDATGHNFIDVVPGTVFTTPAHTYRIVYELVTTGGALLGWYHHHTTSPKQPS